VQEQQYVNVRDDPALLSAVTNKNEIGVEFLKREEVLSRLKERMQSWYEIRVEGNHIVMPASWPEEDGKIKVCTLYCPIMFWLVLTLYDDFAAYTASKKCRILRGLIDLISSIRPR